MPRLPVLLGHPPLPAYGNRGTFSVGRIEMCGIAGEAGIREFIKAGEPVIVQSMCDTIQHRGPDDEGYQCIASMTWAINLGMRRLSIIDRAAGQQPMNRGAVTLVFNGEIYNHRRLRHNLTQVGVQFKTDCDTEALAWTLDRHGMNGLSMLEGMFAFAAWNRNDRKLYLVRDRVGKKPLYYYWNEDKNILLFGSEIKAILANPLYEKAINWAGISHFLSLQYVPEPMTAFAGIQCVPAGHYATYDPNAGSFDVTPWWTLKPGPEIPDEQECIARLKQTMETAVVSRLESEVPIGVYLSGGIDSSIIAAIAKQYCEELHTFTMGFKEEQYSEIPLARQFAEHIGTIHHEAIVEIPQLPEMAQRISDQYDQPFGDCSAIPTMLLAEASKQYITVALSGDGGDEAFGGYQRYAMAGQKQGIIGYLNWMTPIPFQFRDGMLSDSFKAKLADTTHTRSWMIQYILDAPVKDFHNQMMWLDTLTYLPNDIVVKMERATMAASVEARCPFLDHRIQELAFAIPPQYKIAGGEVGKYILKEAFMDIIPLIVLMRQKRGFSVPINEWFRQDIGKTMLADMTSDMSWPWDMFDPTKIAMLIESHIGGASSCGHSLWMLLMLHMWMKKHFG